jgi:hypothetical protein
MSGLRRIAFGAGFFLGLGMFVLLVSNVLLYLLTGRLPAVEMKGDGRPAFALVTPQEVVRLVREQVERERQRATSLESGDLS